LQLAAILRRQGREAEVVIGFRRTADGRFVGHAWVEGAGVPRDDAGHLPVLRLTAGSDGAELRGAVTPSLPVLSDSGVFFADRGTLPSK
jgi:hypothetical protein